MSTVTSVQNAGGVTVLRLGCRGT